MRKKLIVMLVCMLMCATAISVAATLNTTPGQVNERNANPGDFMMPSGTLKSAAMNYVNQQVYRFPNEIPQSMDNPPAPDYQFIKLPTTLMTSWYDYMPGSYAGFPIRLQTGNGNGGQYLTYHGTASTTAQRYQYYAYANAACNIVSSGRIVTYDKRQGYGGIAIHPTTGDCIASWHEAYDVDTPLETRVTYDDYDAGETPGVWKTPLLIDDAKPNEYVWPYMYVGPSPVGVDYVRVYKITNNNALVGSYPCEDANVSWTDVKNVNGQDLSSLLNIASWSWTTVFTSWRDPNNLVRPFQAFAVDYNVPGKVAFIGYDAYLVTGPNMPVDEGAFVWESYDYGQTWDTANLHTDGTGANLYQVDNIPGFEDNNGNVLPVINVSIAGGHMTALFDANGNLHCTYLQQYGFSDATGDYYWPYFMPQAEMVWDGSTFTFHEVPLMPGVDPLSGHSVPWDEEYLYPTVGWSTYPDASGEATATFHENTQKQAINKEKNWMVQMWCDGTYSKYAKDNPDFDQNYVDHPMIYLSVSNDSGNTWSDPIVLTDIYSEKFNFFDQITVYPYLCDQIVDLGKNWGQIFIYYYDDNSFGSYARNTQGTNAGGNITYCSIKIRFSPPTYNEAPDPAPYSTGALFGEPQNGFPGWVWFSIPLIPADSAKPDDILGFNCKGILYRWDPYLKAVKVYVPPFSTFDLEVGQSYLLRLNQVVENPGYYGYEPDKPFEIKLGRQGWTWVGLPGTTPLGYPNFMNQVKVQYPVGGPIRTAAEDRTSGNPWINWGWSFYDTYLQAPKTLTPYSPFGNNICYPWLGYRLYVNVGTAQTPEDPDQVTLIWPAE